MPATNGSVKRYLHMYRRTYMARELLPITTYLKGLSSAGTKRQHQAHISGCVLPDVPDLGRRGNVNFSVCPLLYLTPRTRSISTLDFIATL